MLFRSGLLFGVELLWGCRGENKKQELKDDRARADRKLNYMAYGTRGMKEGDMSIGDFTVYFAAITGVGEWLTKLSNAISGYMEVNHDVTDLRHFLNLSDQKENKEESLQHQKEVISFTFDNVSFSYQKEPIIRNLNFTILGGEKIAIVGINGAGKSTLIKLLCGMLYPDQGRILVNGQDSRRIDRKKYFGMLDRKSTRLNSSHL